MSDWFIAWPDWKYKVEREEWAMPEHVHKWRFGYRADGNYNLPGASTPGFYCRSKECGYDSGTWLSLTEGESRLNATERLSAELAREIGDCLYAGIIDHERKSAVLAYADTLWKAADALRGQVDAAEYKHVVLGLLFLKYISDSFEARREELGHDHTGLLQLLAGRQPRQRRPRRRGLLRADERAPGLGRRRQR